MAVSTDTSNGNSSSTEGAVSMCGNKGCSQPGTKLCSRCGREAYCSADCQRKAWREHKTVCQKVESPENSISELLRAGRLYSVQQQLQQLPKANPRLSSEFEEKLKVGIYSEIVEERIALADIPNFGRGYIAAKDIAVGEVVLFDTAFASAPVDGEKEFHFLITEKMLKRAKDPSRRTNPVKDAQADFFYNRVLTLPLKGGMERRWIEDTLDSDQTEQMLSCAIAEGNCLWCSEDPNFMALFAATAWFNHSCAPNAALESNRSTALVRALASIQVGTEVTISYLPSPLLDDGESRRKRLQGGRGFSCRCHRCISEGFVGSEESIAG